MNLIVGAGLSGCVLAELIARVAKEEVVLIDKRSHIAGNLYDEYLNGILIHRYGPHIFHTNHAKVWEYINRFAEFYPYIHRVLAMIDGVKIPIPFNLQSMSSLFPENMAKRFINELERHFAYGAKISILELLKIQALHPLADFIYSKIFKNYTQKQWGVSLETLDESVARRVPFVFGKSNCYFNDCFQGIPLGGYTEMVCKMIKNPRIELCLNQDYKSLDFKILKSAKRIFYCGGIDEYFDYKFGALQYRGIKFEFQTLNQEFFQENSVINYPNQYDFTRITEYKYFLPHKQQDKTVISKEYPSQYKIGENEQCYPIPCPKQRELYEKYLSESKKLNHVFFLGRLGKYQYLDMDQVIKDSMQLFCQIFQKNIENI